MNDLQRHNAPMEGWWLDAIRLQSRLLTVKWKKHERQADGMLYKGFARAHMFPLRTPNQKCEAWDRAHKSIPQR